MYKMALSYLRQVQSKPFLLSYFVLHGFAFERDKKKFKSVKLKYLGKSLLLSYTY